MTHPTNICARYDGLHTQGVGSNTAHLFECEFKFWNVATWK